jgi:hypothetical protein
MLAAAKWGAALGALAYVVLRLGLSLLAPALLGNGAADLDHPALLTSACLGIVGLLFAFSAAGYFAARETGRAGTGALAGLLAFVLYAALSAVYTPGGSTPSSGTASTLSTVAQAASALVALLLGIGIAALMGWLGGRPGAQNGLRRRKQQVSAADGVEIR